MKDDLALAQLADIMAELERRSAGASEEHQSTLVELAESVRQLATAVAAIQPCRSRRIERDAAGNITRIVEEQGD